jgi:hypothetical protein
MHASPTINMLRWRAGGTRCILFGKKPGIGPAFLFRKDLRT